MGQRHKGTPYILPQRNSSLPTSPPNPTTKPLRPPPPQASAVVRLEMVDSSGLLYSDEFALSFHMHFHRLLKWAVALPLGLMLAVLAAVAGPAGRTHSA